MMVMAEKIHQEVLRQSPQILQTRFVRSLESRQLPCDVELAARSLSDLGNRREVVGERGQMCAHSRRIVGLFNDNDRAFGPLSHRRSRFILSPTGS